MSEKLGVVVLKTVVVSAARILNAVSKLVHKHGLVALFPVIREVQDLAKMDWPGVLLELKDLSAEESDELEAVLKSELQLQNPAVQVKLLDALDCAQLAAAVVVHELAVIEEAKAVVEKVKLLVA